MNSTYAGMLTSAKTAIDALSLGVTCVIRKLPLRQETIDTLPQIIVCPADKPEEYKRFCFGDVFTFEPTVQVVIIAANNADEANTSLTTRLDWRESIANALSDLNVGLASELQYDAPLDRKLLSENYDYLSLGWRATLWV